MTFGGDTARSLAEKYLARIEAIDRSGPTLRSAIEVNPDARTIADGLDRERASGRVRGPLHGIPILLKDNIATADRMMTTAGTMSAAHTELAEPGISAGVPTSSLTGGRLAVGSRRSV